MIKTIATVGVLCALATAMTGCVKVDPASRTDSKYGKASFTWGVPAIHETTAGFNGSPSEEVGDKSNSTQQK